MARDWPAERHRAADRAGRRPAAIRSTPDGTYRLSEAQARAILDLRLQRLTALGRDEIGDELNKLAAEIADYLDILRSRARIMAIVQDELEEIRDRARHAAPDRDRRIGRRFRGRGPDPARGHGRHGQPCRLHQARAALDLSRAAPRRQGPLGHADARGGFRHAPVRRQHPHAGAVLLLEADGSTRRRSGGCRSPRRRRAARRWSTCCRSSGTSGSPRSCRCPRTRRPGRRSTSCSRRRRAAVRRNKLSDFVQVNRAGKIAMKLDEGEQIVDVAICTEADDVLLTTARGQCIRFPVSRRARLQGPRLRWACAASGWTRSDTRDLDGDHPPCRGRRPTSARPISRCAAPCAGESGERREAADDEDEDGAPAPVEISTGALCRAVGRRAVHPDRVGKWLRQAHLVLRVPDHRPRRQRASSRWRSTSATARSSASFPVEHADQIMLVTEWRAADPLPASTASASSGVARRA